jgi:hypothetical protein
VISTIANPKAGLDSRAELSFRRRRAIFTGDTYMDRMDRTAKADGVGNGLER